MKKELNNFEKWVLKKRSIWFHILVSYFTCFIWTIIYFVCKSKQKTIYNSSSLNKTSLNTMKLHVAGVTFDNRQEIIKTLKIGQKIKLELYDYKGSSAIKVLTENNKQIGNIRKNDIHLFAGIENKIVTCKVSEIDEFINEDNVKIMAVTIIVYYK